MENDLLDYYDLNLEHCSKCNMETMHCIAREKRTDGKTDVMKECTICGSFNVVTTK
ncbi:hypothetical protein [Vallitalea maricola]|uniref:Uncharacterized protein n=1 Tax=Vallitalea maricola TaxID=3074433 RepID=A0ACB5UNQ2_9FIRM|nr:hypothetical protein AN2V17_34160 [Vallitalea sp. AN17-2]